MRMLIPIPKVLDTKTDTKSKWPTVDFAADMAAAIAKSKQRKRKMKTKASK